MEFYTEFKKRKTIPHPECNKLVQEYREVIDKEGKVKLEETEKINIYEKIQEAGEGIILNELIEKYAMKINQGNVMQLDELIEDFTEVPDNMIDAMNLIDKAKNIYEKQPKDIKNAFNNNFNEFIAGAENGGLKTYLEQNEQYRKEKEKINTEVKKSKNENEILKNQVSIEDLQKQIETLKNQGVKYE